METNDHTSGVKKIDPCRLKVGVLKAHRRGDPVDSPLAKAWIARSYWLRHKHLGGGEIRCFKRRGDGKRNLQTFSDWGEALPSKEIKGGGPQVLLGQKTSIGIGGKARGYSGLYFCPVCCDYLITQG